MNTDRETWGNRRMAQTQAGSGRRLGMTRQQKVVVVAFVLIILLGTFLRFYNLGAYSMGNSYYAATVQSMLTSWHNFFFASFEPGGSVTVDKPPLGFWVQAASAYLFGVNGFALALPQALAGVLSIPLLYAMVKRQFGVWAGLTAALVLAVMPVAVSTERNNTMDGLLLFVLLLAAWAFLKAVRSGRFGFLLLGAFLVGLGFNIKMLQAFLPLPALYALYLLGARHPWWKRILHLAGATVLLVAVSLSWAIAVDLTPAEERPYIGSSDNNTVMELIVGHNGLKRLGLSGLLASNDALPGGGSAGLGGSRPGLGQGTLPPPPPGDGPMGPPPQNAPGQRPDSSAGPAYPPPLPGAGADPSPQRPGSPPAQPSSGLQSPPPPTGQNPPGRQPGGRNQEVGEPGVFRLFSEPLVTEASWTLPLALLGIPLVLVVLGRPWPLSEKHLALLLWAGWLLPEVLYFSFNAGLFHAYYLIMLGPPLAASVGATAWALGQVWQKRPWLGWALVALFAGVTVAFQIVTLQSYPDYAVGVAAFAVALLLAGLGMLLLAARRPRSWLASVALGMVLLATVAAPLTWSSLTTLNTDPNVALPSAGPSDGQGSPWGNLSSAQEAILDYLLAHTDPDSYLLATLRATEAAPYILATGRPVLTFGGFMGSDDVVDVDELAQMIADGELRYVLDQGLPQQKPEIANWVTNHCTVVSVPGVDAAASNGPASRQGGPGQAGILYDCAGYMVQNP